MNILEGLNQENQNKNIFPWTLLVKEFVLDLLWANNDKYSNENWTVDFDKLPDEIKKVIYSTNIDEILWLIKWLPVDKKQASILWMLEKLEK